MDNRSMVTEATVYLHRRIMKYTVLASTNETVINERSTQAPWTRQGKVTVIERNV